MKYSSNGLAPVEVLQPKSSAAYMQKAASVGSQINMQSINRVGAVANRGQIGSGSDIFPETITATYTNSTTTPVTLLLFDPAGLVAAVAGLSGTVSPTWGSGISNAVNNKWFENRPVVFSGFNYRVTTGSAAQYDNQIFYRKAGIDGSSFSKPLNIGQYQRNTQQNTTIQTVEAQFVIDQFAALTLVVGANTTIALDFYFKEVLQTVNG